MTLVEDGRLRSAGLEGVAVDITMIGNLEAKPGTGTGTLRLPTGTARQLGLVPPAWEKK